MHYVSAHHQVLVFEGVDALAFLQSQLTNDVAALAIGTWQWQGYCNAKGRLHATFALARTGEATFMAVVHSSVVPFLAKRLTMFRLRSKLTITVSESLQVVHHLEAPKPESETTVTLALGEGRWVTIEDNKQNQRQEESAEYARAWNRLGVLSRQPEIVALTNEMFVPQMIAWDRVSPGGGVSFSKGCYPGQEIVARAHYRGAVKRKLMIETLPTTTNLEPGQELTRDDGTIVEVVNAVVNDGKTFALVVAPITAGAANAAPG
jgi:tRNA-modifying protein YgfZ